MKCIAKVLNLHDDNDSKKDILKADTKEGHRLSWMNRDKNSKNEVMEYSLLKKYITTLNDYKPKLENLLSSLEVDITEHGKNYDNLLLKHSEDDQENGDVDFLSIDDALEQERIVMKTLQKRKLACIEILTIVNELIEVNFMCLISYD